ncbi:MAG TPA: class I SAM-dependent methyltransferase [Actinomycetota bacterium]|nr:class I SAM-dependent methyltransferase [Actinomycetota bacterium]
MSVQAQYSRGTLLADLEAALVAAGRDPEHLGPDDLSEFEEFHTLGRPATMALAEAAQITATDHVLDAGCGLGGPARTLARLTGCTVTAVDLTEEFCTTADALTRHSGLAGQVAVLQADARVLPFPAGAFDVTWTQHVSMNIEDKAGFYTELRRVLKPGGRLAFFDVMAGPTQPVHFPALWTSEPAWSHLATPEETRAAVEAAGFEPTVWEDVTALALAFFTMAATFLAAGPPPPLGLHLVIKDMPAKVQNMRQDLEEGRVTLLRGVAVAR